MSSQENKKNSKTNYLDFTEKPTEWCEGFEIILKKEAEQSESLFWSN
jgi:hypothetical protein